MLLSLNIQAKVKRGRRLGESPNFFFSSALQRLEAFSKIQKKDCGNYLTYLAPKIASLQKTSWTAAAQTKTTPDNNPELCIWLDFFPQLMQIEQNWNPEDTDNCLWMLTLTWPPLWTTQQGNTDVPPQHQTQFTSLLPSYLLKNSYSCLAPGTPITKPGRGWTLL